MKKTVSVRACFYLVVSLFMMLTVGCAGSSLENRQMQYKIFSREEITHTPIGSWGPLLNEEECKLAGGWWMGNICNIWMSQERVKKILDEGNEKGWEK